ncbi:MAG: hypothetical protein GX567_00880 [Clostridia bacterium]|nr:hypothetical protein [Clostridia bacterium]
MKLTNKKIIICMVLCQAIIFGFASLGFAQLPDNNPAESPPTQAYTPIMFISGPQYVLASSTIQRRYITDLSPGASGNYTWCVYKKPNRGGSYTWLNHYYDTVFYTPGEYAVECSFTGTIANVYYSSSATTTVTVVSLSVTWEKYADNANLWDLTENGFGYGVFPGKTSYTDTETYRNCVKAVAHTTSAASGQTIYFRFFDVDDRSSSTVIDENGSAGDDNFGSDICNMTYATTDNDGNAEVTFSVGMQPGDNYKVYASFNSSSLQELTQAQVDANQIPPDIAESEVLTTFRKLWVEIDSMASVSITGAEKNFQEGTVTSISQNTPSQGKTTVNLDIKLEDEADRYESGFMLIDGQYYEIESNSNNLIRDSVVVDVLVPSSAVNKSFQIYDDDYTYLNGNISLQITLPFSADPNLISKIRSPFLDAYIYPISVPSAYIQNNVGFDRNSDIISSSKDLVSSDDFWTAYLLMSWQPDIDRDWDPIPEDSDGVLGMATDSGNKGAVYLAVIRELENYMAAIDFWAVCAHEIGHQGGANHEGSGLMATPYHRDYLSFDDESIFTLRTGTDF